MREEEQLIRIARKHRKAFASSPTAGLALSGGGIRSAAFHLGVIQALATFGHLKTIDYVSAVSGGGYTASWLAKLILDKDFENAHRELLVAPGERSSTAVGNLRAKASAYLTPHIGPLTEDTGLLITTYIHNFLFNVVVCFLLILLALCLPRLGMLFLRSTQSWRTEAAIIGGTLALGSAFVIILRISTDRAMFEHFAPRGWRWLWLCVLLPFVGWSIAGDLGYSRPPVTVIWCATALAVGRLLLPLQNKGSALNFRYWQAIVTSSTVIGLVLAAVDLSKLFPVWHSALLASVPYAWCIIALSRDRPDEIRRKFVPLPAILSGFLICAWFFFGEDVPSMDSAPSYARLLQTFDSYTLDFRLTLVIGSVVLLCIWVFLVWPQRTESRRFGELPTILAAIMAAGTLALLAANRSKEILHVFAALRHRFSPEGAFTPTFVIIAPACIVVGTFLTNLALALGGRPSLYKNERVTALSSAIYGYTIMWWTVPCILSLYGPAIVHWLSPNALCFAIFIWLAALILGLFDTTRGVPRLLNSMSLPFRFLVWCSPYLFLIGLILFASWVLNDSILRIRWQGYQAYMADLYSTYHPFLICLTAALAMASWLLSTRFGINMSSMHVFYQGRLAEAFLNEKLPGFRTKRERDERRVHDEDSRGRRLYDVTHLEDLIPRENDVKPYGGPYLILNASVNMSRSPNLRCRDKKALNFVFTPKYSGYTPEPPFVDPGGLAKEPIHAYRPTSKFGFGDEPGIRLAFAMATSGSALGPNMGRYTTLRRRVINTVLNLRLGWWISNPGHPTAWSRSMPRSRLFLLISEFLGTDDSGTFINLSDGGHFENLGLYELARRRCDLIVISDASQDESTSLSSLGIAVERCRTDFGYEVDLDTSSFVQQIRSQQLEHAFLVGRISYSPERSGVILYFKAARLRHLPPDLTSYAASNKTFPHQATGNQWFSESRFESYRKLGLQIAADFLTGVNESGETLIAHIRRLTKSKEQKGASSSAGA